MSPAITATVAPVKITSIHACDASLAFIHRPRNPGVSRNLRNLNPSLMWS